MNGGWRPLAATPGCRAQAADVLRSYRERVQRRIGTLYWHEGQLRAELGETDAAIALLERGRHPTDEDGWNDYVDATIAFLRNDRRRLLAVRDRLAERPKPADWATGVDTKGNPVAAPPWPMNLNVVDRLIACFGRSYREAYRCEVPAPSNR